MVGFGIAWSLSNASMLAVVTSGEGSCETVSKHLLPSMTGEMARLVSASCVETISAIIYTVVCSRNQSISKSMVLGNLHTGDEA
eukprot:4764100-Amphidinium_carterae.1